MLLGLACITSLGGKQRFWHRLCLSWRAHKHLRIEQMSLGVKALHVPPRRSLNPERAAVHSGYFDTKHQVGTAPRVNLSSWIDAGFPLAPCDSGPRLSVCVVSSRWMQAWSTQQGRHNISGYADGADWLPICLKRKTLRGQTFFRHFGTLWSAGEQFFFFHSESPCYWLLERESLCTWGQGRVIYKEPIIGFVQQNFFSSSFHTSHAAGCEAFDTKQNKTRLTYSSKNRHMFKDVGMERLQFPRMPDYFLEQTISCLYCKIQMGAILQCDAWCQKIKSSWVFEPFISVVSDQFAGQ